VTQLHLLARLDGKRRNTRRLDSGNEVADATRNLYPVLVELALPQHAGLNAAAQRLLRVKGDGRRALMRAEEVPHRSQMTQLQNVQTRHGFSPFI
jgi:hypothetical protein